MAGGCVKGITFTGAKTTESRNTRAFLRADNLHLRGDDILGLVKNASGAD